MAFLHEQQFTLSSQFSTYESAIFLCGAKNKIKTAKQLGLVISYFRLCILSTMNQLELVITLVTQLKSVFDSLICLAISTPQGALSFAAVFDFVNGTMYVMTTSKAIET
jgi:hypothetical protein